LHRVHECRPVRRLDFLLRALDLQIPPHRRFRSKITKHSVIPVSTFRLTAERGLPPIFNVYWTNTWPYCNWPVSSITPNIFRPRSADTGNWFFISCTSK
jgi:hypothetical protein